MLIHTVTLTLQVKPEKEERMELMRKVMKACLTKKWETKIHIVYMFYSKDNGNVTKNISKTMLYDAEDVEDFSAKGKKS